MIVSEPSPLIFLGVFRHVSALTWFKNAVQTLWHRRLV